MNTKLRRLVHQAALGLFVSLSLIACSGSSGGGDGQEGEGGPSSGPMQDKRVYKDAVTVRGDIAAKALGDQPIPTDAHLKGMWSSVVDWPLIAIHAVLMPDGRVLTYGSDSTGEQTGNFIYDVWNPAVGLGPSSHLTLPNQTGTDLFCSSQLVLPQSGAGVVISGGDVYTSQGTQNSPNNNSNVFSYTGNTLTRGSNMQRQRWYATSTVLLNGEVYLQGGTGGEDRPEIRGTNGTYRLLSGANTNSYYWYYPRNFLAPDGRIFGYDINGKMYYVNTSGTGSLTSAGQFPLQYGGDASSAVMFRPGRILQFGGNSSGAVVLDINGSSPVATPTQSMSSQRYLLSGTVLPNGHVLATGGSSEWNELIGVNNRAEIWNPTTGTWTLGSAGALARLYHSNALLLPDASVLVAGGGAPGPLNNLNAEIYYPPYLFSSGGVAAPRPRIVTAPAQLVVGQSFDVDFADAASVSRVVLIRTGSNTHSWNMEQRFIELAFTASGQRLSAQMSSRAADTPPGYYMLFVLDAQGVPSVARIVWIDVAGATPPTNTPPVISNPGNQTGVVGAALSLQVQATDAESNPLTFSATGLPPGLSISTSGRISGTPSTQGSFNTVVSVSDGTGSDSASFGWTITQGSQLVLDPIPTPAPAQSGTDVSFTASASGSGVQYSWNFGDGSAPTAFSSSKTVTYRYTTAGLFFVTLTARDSGGAQQTRSALQVVHLPLTARAPTQSSSVAYDRNGGGTPRVWVVNPDNDTVSLFNANTGAKIAEVAVGTSPRSVALDALGQAWVANKRSANLSIIDRASLAVSRTIAMPRVSQPHGIAMSPAGDFAYVVLEATGELLKYNTATFGKLGTVSVGPNPRHVAVSADGASVYVSRFITPPLPGESTTTVQTTLNGLPVGGEVVKLRASDLSSQGTIVLGFGTKADAENQGRGVPNYLGAMAISPDGSQAWVPSKQDNVQRGEARDGNPLNFQNTVRAISSRIAMGSGVEDLARRIDHDNASVASAAAFDPLGVVLFVALETSREIAVINAHTGAQLFRFDVGRAPQGVAVSPDGRILYVSNFMDRTLGIHDLSPLWNEGRLEALTVAAPRTIGTDKLGVQVLAGKQLFYDARDARLARDRYMSCASCHNDAGHDGRVWDLTSLGEGLRNTIALSGRAGNRQGFLHWSANFDEVQDFEGQIRNLAGGSGLMTDSAFFAGTRSQPLGTPKAGISADLDAIAAYLGSLSVFEYTPYRPSGTTLSAAATSGKALFQTKGCGNCHAGAAYTGSGVSVRVDVGTAQPSSGTPLVSGVDIPTLRDAWATAPYLHNGSQPTVDAAIGAHTGLSLTTAERSDLAAYVKSIGREEDAPLVPTGPGSGLRGQYFNNRTLSGTPVLTRNEAVDFSWKQSPGSGVPANNFSVRWTGRVVAPATGSYYFQTIANDGVRLWVKDQLVVDNWVAHSSNQTVTSAAVNLVAGETAAVVMEYYDVNGGAVVRLRWQTPGNTTTGTIPADRLLPN